MFTRVNFSSPLPQWGKAAYGPVLRVRNSLLLYPGKGPSVPCFRAETYWETAHFLTFYQ